MQDAVQQIDVHAHAFWEPVRQMIGYYFWRIIGKRVRMAKCDTDVLYFKWPTLQKNIQGVYYSFR